MEKDITIRISELMDLFDEGEVTTADQIERPEDPFRDFNERNPKAGGGMLVKPSADGSRPGYAKDKTGWKEETEKLSRWIENNRDTFDFANSSSKDVLKASKVNLGIGTVQKYLANEGIQTKTALAKTQERPKYTKKVLEELREGLPKGISLEQTRPGQYYFKVLLKGKKVNKPNITKSMVANETNKKEIINFFNKKVKEYYPGRMTDDEFKKLRLANKDMTTEEFAKFLDGEGKTTYLGDEWNKSNVSRTQNRLDIGKGITGPQTVRTFEEAKKIAKTYPGGKLLLKSGASEKEILKFVANKISQEKQGLGGKKGFPIGTTKENKMWRNFYNSALKEDGRMQLITEIPKDANGNINWKIKDKNGVHAWKNAKFFDKKTGATYTWGGDYKPGDLAKQVDAAYGKGFFAKSVKVYDEQAAFNRKTFNGKALNEIFREGLLKKELELKLNRSLTNSKADQKILKDFYALRKPNFSFTEAHHIEGVGQNPFRMEVSYRAANRAQNDLLNSFNAGNITKAQYAEGMERLSDTKGGIRYKTSGRFIGATATPESIIKAAGADINMKPAQIKDIEKLFSDNPNIKNVGQKLAAIGCPNKAMGGRVEFNLGGSAECITRGLDNLRTGNMSPAAKANARALMKTSPRVLSSAARIIAGLGFGTEAVLGGFFAATDYATGANKDEIISNLTYGIGGKSLEEQAQERNPLYNQALNLENVYSKYLAGFDEQGLPITGKNPRGMRKVTTEQNVLEAMKPFMTLSTPPSLGFEKEFDMSGFEKALGTLQELENEKTERALQRGFYEPGIGGSQRIDEFAAAGGGIAGLSGGIDKGPQRTSMNPDSQGLSGLLKRGIKR